MLILDSDVILPPHGIRRLVEFMEKNPKAGYVQLLLHHDVDNRIYRWQHEVCKGKICKIISCTACALVRKRVFDIAGLYDESLGPPFSVDEDLEMGARIWKAGYECLQIGTLEALHLMVKRDRYLAEIEGSARAPAQATMKTLSKDRPQLSWKKAGNELLESSFSDTVTIKIKDIVSIIVLILFHFTNSFISSTHNSINYNMFSYYSNALFVSTNGIFKFKKHPRNTRAVFISSLELLYKGLVSFDMETIRTYLVTG